MPAPPWSDAAPGEKSRHPDDLWHLPMWRLRVAPLVSTGSRYDWAAIAIVVGYNPIINSVIPDAFYIPANLLAVSALIWVALQSGATADLMGMQGGRLRRGITIGAIAAGLAIVAVCLLTVLPWTRSYLADDRFIGVTWAEALYETAGRIPVGTAISEEIMFRGVLLGLLLRRFTVGGAVAASAVLFGLWHILPTLNAIETNPVGDTVDTPVATAAAVAGAVATTAAAGVVFSWLRFRAASIAAPIVLHSAINSSAYLAGWLVVKNGWTA